MAAFWRPNTEGRPIGVYKVAFLLQGALVSVTERFQELQYGKKIEALNLEAPAFILGHWRSGQRCFMRYSRLTKN
jgi:hypothetical protein